MAEEMEHPTWCDLDECLAGERLSLHRSAPYKIHAMSLGDVTIEAHLRSNADEPVSEASVSIELLVERTDCTSIEGFELDGRTVRQLYAMLEEMLPALTS